MTRQAFNLSTGADTGGAAIRSVEAFRAEADRTEWTLRAMVAASNYIRYPPDLPYSRDELENQYDHADVVHLNHTLHGHTWYDAEQGKPIVLEHHGLHKGAFDIDFDGSIAAGIEVGAVQIGSTANLELFGPPGTITWAPIPYDLAALRALRQHYLQSPRHPLGSPIRIAHAPTNREIKSTAAFLSAIKALKERGVAVEAVLIETKRHSVCLDLKATADIIVDQLKLGYGCNAIEAWWMGLPVVGGIEDPTWRRYMVARWGGMPLVEATEESLASVLFDLVQSSPMRTEYAQKGAEHVARWHSQAGHVAQMSAIYDSARPSRPASLAFANRLRLPYSMSQPVPQPVPPRKEKVRVPIDQNRERFHKVRT
jgi:hypothetical protein